MDAAGGIPGPAEIRKGTKYLSFWPFVAKQTRKRRSRDPLGGVPELKSKNEWKINRKMKGLGMLNPVKL